MYDSWTEGVKKDLFSSLLFRVDFDRPTELDGVSECKYGHGIVITFVIIRSSVVKLVVIIMFETFE